MMIWVGDLINKRTPSASQSNYHPNVSKKYARKRNDTIDPTSGAGSEEFWDQFD